MAVYLKTKTDECSIYHNVIVMLCIRPFSYVRFIVLFFIASWNLACTVPVTDALRTSVLPNVIC